MEATSKPTDIENPYPISSQNTNESANTTTNNMDFAQIQIQTPPLTPRSSDHHQINPYPATFIQANTSTFKQVVQMLTGSSSSSSSSSQSKQNPESNYFNNSNKNPIPPIKTSQKKQQQQQQGTFKLYERRNQLRNKLNIINPMINSNNMSITTGTSNFSLQKHEMILSPSMLDFPKRLVLSPVTPLYEDPFNSSSNSSSNISTSAKSSLSEEDKAIAEKRFYLHQSPVNTPRECQPELLPLFPVTSPRVSGSFS